MFKVCKYCGEKFETNRSKREYCSHSCANTIIARDRENIKVLEPLTTVWSCGGGVQSTAIAVLICQGKLPKPDYAIMTDCGWEKSATWEYVYGVIIPKLRSIDLNLHIIKTIDYSHNDLFDKSGHLVLPAYKYINGKAVRFNTHCNDAWKVKPAKRWIREQGIQRCENWLGISVNEFKRVKESNHKWFIKRYPLIEMGLTREDCLFLIGKSGWPKPPRTSCYICPQQDDATWLSIKLKYPDDWIRAIEVEQQIHIKDPEIFLHRSLKPLDQVVFNR